MDTINHEKFEQIKRDAVFSVNLDSVYLKPAGIKNYFFKETQEDEEEKKEEEEPVESGEKKIWKELGSIMTTDAKIARKDTIEGVEISI